MTDWSLMQQHFSEVSLVRDYVSWGLYVVLAVNIGLTLVHSFQELRGRLWSYFGWIAGLHFPDYRKISGVTGVPKSTVQRMVKKAAT